MGNKHTPRRKGGAIPSAVRAPSSGDRRRSVSSEWQPIGPERPRPPTNEVPVSRQMEIQRWAANTNDLPTWSPGGDLDLHLLHRLYREGGGFPDYFLHAVAEDRPVTRTVCAVREGKTIWIDDHDTMDQALIRWVAGRFANWTGSHFAECDPHTKRTVWAENWPAVEGQPTLHPLMYAHLLHTYTPPGTATADHDRDAVLAQVVALVYGNGEPTNGLVVLLATSSTLVFFLKEPVNPQTRPPALDLQHVPSLLAAMRQYLHSHGRLILHDSLLPTAVGTPES